MKFARDLLGAIILIGAALAGSSVEAQQTGKKPNILFIMGDDIGWMQPSCYHRGLMVGETPNIDRLAREGIRSPRVEGDSHARRRTIQAGDLGERIMHARGNRDDQTEGLCSNGRAARRDERDARYHPPHDSCERESSTAVAWH